MEADRFETLLRAVVTRSSRRGFAGLLGSIALGDVLALEDQNDVSAAKKKKKVTLCLNGQTITVPKKKKGSFLGRGATLGACTSPPATTCSDGIKNGSETDVDCGGSCPRCFVGRACTTQQDCSTALCLDNVCRICASATSVCGTDEGGTCRCAEGVCAGDRGRIIVGDCVDCPAGTGVCTQLDRFAFACLPLCGEAIP